MPTPYTGNPAGGSFTSPAPAPNVSPGSTIPTDLTDPVNAGSVAPEIQTALDWAAYFNRQRARGDAAGGAATSFDGGANPTTWNDLLTTDGAPVSGLDVLPTFAAGSGFAVTIGGASGFLYTAVGIGPGESTYRTIYWSSQSKTLSNPDGSHARIDAITVTPAAFGSESTLAVIAGTPATTPLPPAIPSGSAALFYVLVPAAGADATVFRACRGLGRRVGYPWSGMTGILAGAELSWDYTQDPASGSATMYVGAADRTGSNFTVNRLLIDGEAIEWTGYLTDIAGIVSDSTANPFGTTASASFDRPYYVYACGGRHNPLPSSGPFAAFLNPVTICESTVPPNPKTGKPTGNLTVNGVTVTPDGAVYLGLGFVAQGTSHRRGCVMDAEMTYSLDRLQIINHSFTTNAAEDIGTFTGGAQPAISTKMVVNLVFAAPTAAEGTVLLRLQNFAPLAGIGGVVSGVIMGLVPAAKSQAACNQLIAFTPRSGAELWATLSSSSIAGSSLIVGAMGFDHRVRRLLAGY